MAGAATEADIVWFDSKVDWWLAILLAALPLICIGTLVALAVSGENLISGLLPCLLIAGIYGGLLFPVKYGIGQSDLIVRYGLMRKRIGLSSISEVRRTRNPLSSPALSLDRLKIKYGPGLMSFTLISPGDQTGFRDLLAQRTGNPGLRRDA